MGIEVKVLGRFKQRVKNFVRPPRYRLLSEIPQIENVVKCHLRDQPVRSLRLILHSTDSFVADVNDAWIFKFPKSEYCARQLEKEKKVLDYCTQHLAIPIPSPTVHSDGYFYTAHPKLVGDTLSVWEYSQLNEHQKNQLAEDLALFFAQLHSLPLAEAEALGVGRRLRWKPWQEIFNDVEKQIPLAMLPYVRRVLEQFDETNENNVGEVFGHFDVHGENMAFDHASRRITGIFDFADASIGDYHKDLQSTSWISSDLTERISPKYEKISGREVDRERIKLLHAGAEIVNLALAKGTRPEVVEYFILKHAGFQQP